MFKLAKLFLDPRTARKVRMHASPAECFHFIDRDTLLRELQRDNYASPTLIGEAMGGEVVAGDEASTAYASSIVTLSTFHTAHGGDGDDRQAQFQEDTVVDLVHDVFVIVFVLVVSVMCF